MGDFSLAFQNITTKSIKKTENIIRATVFDVEKEIISNSAVDTGRYKANWQVTLNTPATSTIDAEDKTGNTTIAKNKAVIFNNPIPLVYWIINNLDYAMKAEYGLWTTKPSTAKTIGGYSRTSPNGAVRITLQRFNKFLKDNIKW